MNLQHNFRSTNKQQKGGMCRSRLVFITERPRETDASNNNLKVSVVEAVGWCLLRLDCPSEKS